MKELLVFLAKNLVENPDEVEVTEEENGEDLLLKLKVASSDMGKVIGRGGRTAKDLRTLLRAAGGRAGRRVNVEIVE